MFPTNTKEPPYKNTHCIIVRIKLGNWDGNLNGRYKIGKVIFPRQAHFFADASAGNLYAFKGLTCKRDNFAGIHIQPEKGTKPSFRRR